MKTPPSLSLVHPGIAPKEFLVRFLERHASIPERMASGKKLRKRVPRSAHARFKPPSSRPDPVEILQRQSRIRLKDLVPIRYGRMLSSPFAFLRGAAAVMAADLATTPTTRLNVQACGDMHVVNFGIFASAERNLVFGINDFDETHPGPWEWDLKRLTTSAVVAARFLGGDKALSEASARAAVAGYRLKMREYAEMGHLQVCYSRIDEREVLAVLSPGAKQRAEVFFDKARKHTNLQVLEKMTTIVDKRQRIVEDPPLIVRETRTVDGAPLLKALEMFLRSYVPTLNPDRRRLLSHYQILDVARKVVGVGSVGTRCWVIFLRGNHNDDPLFLQMKEAEPSVLVTYGGLKARTENEGRRVVEGQRLIQGAPDIFLGWGEMKGIQYYVRQLRDMKGGLEFDADNPRRLLPEYCGLCGWALALAHAKSGDAAAIAGYVGTSDALDEAFAKFAKAYADQTERDHEALSKAARQGKIPVARERAQRRG
jgi:uncharacterized protein (DUF2252 family)